MRNNDPREKFPLKLLVEGREDLFVVAGIRDKHKLPDNFHIVDCESIDKMPDQIVAHIKQQRPTVDAIGIVVDADLSLKARWDSLKYQLSKMDYVVPDQPQTDGTIIGGVGRNPTVGIWIMPDNLQSGMLEDFVKNLIPVDDQLRPFVQQILLEIEREQIDNRYDPRLHQAKAFVHTWLAWQKDPSTPMGLALTKTYLDHNTALCIRFVDWLVRLFT